MLSDGSTVMSKNASNASASKLSDSGDTVTVNPSLSESGVTQHTEMRFGVQVDTTQICGLYGISDDFAHELLKKFTKNEIVDDPLKVLTAFLENITISNIESSRYSEEPSLPIYQIDNRSVVLHEVRIPDNSVHLKEIKKTLFKQENP